MFVKPDARRRPESIPETWSMIVVNILISWSEPTSRELAEILRKWLPTVLPYANPWLSSEDVRKGRPWDLELTRRLDGTSYAIVCVTTLAVARAPWVNFEAGAVSKYVERGHVSPLLLAGVSPDDLGNLPLARYQCTEFTKAEVGKLLRSINEAAASRMSIQDIERNLENTWMQLHSDVGALDSSKRADKRADDGEDYDEEEDSDIGWPLEELEEEILGVVARFAPFEEWNRPSLSSVCDQTHEDPNRVQHHLDRLVKGNFLDEHWNTEEPTSYSITPSGREYLVDQNLI